MGAFSVWHWAIVLLIVIIVFGTKKLKNMGQDVGEAIKGFKDGMADTPPADTKATPTAQVQVGSNTSGAHMDSSGSESVKGESAKG